MRCGHRAASSPMHRHTTSPITETRTMAGMAAAPMACTAKGTMPVTRMIPARPMTKAPHQLVPRWSEVATSAGGPRSGSRCSWLHLLWTVGRWACMWRLVDVVRWRVTGGHGGQMALR